MQVIKLSGEPNWAQTGTKYLHIHADKKYGFWLQIVDAGSYMPVTLTEAERDKLILALFAEGHNELANLVKEVAPDFPINENSILSDYLHAIKASFEGVLAANDDVHEVVRTLTEDKTPQDRFQIYLYAEKNADLIRENCKLRREITRLIADKDEAEHELKELRERFL